MRCASKVLIVTVDGRYLRVGRPSITRTHPTGIGPASWLSHSPIVIWNGPSGRSGIHRVQRSTGWTVNCLSSFGSDACQGSHDAKGYGSTPRTPPKACPASSRWETIGGWSSHGHTEPVKTRAFRPKTCSIYFNRVQYTLTRDDNR